MAAASTNNEVSPDTKLIVTVLFLIFIYPVGLLLMWFWTPWKSWIKIILSLPVILVVLAVLMTIVLIAINPRKQFDQANNAKRRADVNTILTTVGQYAADHKSNLAPLKLPAIASDICKGVDCAAGSVDFCSALVPTYLPALPVDPSLTDAAQISDCTADYDTGYHISLDPATKRVVVSAPSTALNEVISVTQ